VSGKVKERRIAAQEEAAIKWPSSNSSMRTAAARVSSKAKAAQIVAFDDPRAEKTKDRIEKPHLYAGLNSNMLIAHFGKTNPK
jgi:Asp/Glu/hydantoin racemase